MDPSQKHPAFCHSPALPKTSRYAVLLGPGNPGAASHQNCFSKRPAWLWEGPGPQQTTDAKLLILRKFASVSRPCPPEAVGGHSQGPCVEKALELLFYWTPLGQETLPRSGSRHRTRWRRAPGPAEATEGAPRCVLRQPWLPRGGGGGSDLGATTGNSTTDLWDLRTSEFLLQVSLSFWWVEDT